MDQMMYGFKLGETYPEPIVDFEVAQRKARELLWQAKNSEHSKRNAPKILERYARRNRRHS